MLLLVAEDVLARAGSGHRAARGDDDLVRSRRELAARERQLVARGDIRAEGNATHADQEVVVVTHVDVDPQNVDQAKHLLLPFVLDSRDDPGVKSFTTIAGESPTVACADAAVLAASISAQAKIPLMPTKLFDFFMEFL